MHVGPLAGERRAPRDATLSAPVAPPSSDATLAARLDRLEVEHKRLRHRNSELRNRLFALQQTLVERMGVTSCGIGEQGSEIFPVEIRPAPRAPVLVIAFGSMGDNSGMAPKQFFGALRDKDCEVVFLKDFRQCWYQQGVLGLTRSVPETAEYLRELIARGDRPAVAVGASSGGFAAILFGALLGLPRVVAFSPQTQVTEKVFRRFRTEDSDIDAFDFDGAHTDLREVLRAHPPAGRIDLHYARDYPLDAAEARRLADVPGVTLRPLAWHGHNTASELRRRGELDQVLDELLVAVPGDSHRRSPAP